MVIKENDHSKNRYKRRMQKKKCLINIQKRDFPYEKIGTKEKRRRSQKTRKSREQSNQF